MKKPAAMLLALLSPALIAGADENAVPVTSDADRCDDIVASISSFYTASFEKIVARKVPRETFSAAMATEMKRQFDESPIERYGAVWQAHFRAVGDQLAPELIEGYIHYQCRTDTLSVPIKDASDPIDAACWNVADDGKMEILDARMRHEDSTDLKRLSRAKILACITMSLSETPDR